MLLVETGSWCGQRFPVLLHDRLIGTGFINEGHGAWSKAAGPQ